MSSAVVDATQDAPPQPPARRAFGWGKAAWALIVAVIALAGSASSLLFAFLPQLKPDPRDSVAAQLSVFAIDPDVSLGDYVVRAYGSLAAAPPALRIPRGERSFPGELVYVRTRVDGFKHRRVRLVASTYDAATQRRFPLGPGGTQSQAVLSARTVELDTPQHEHGPAVLDREPAGRAPGIRAHRDVRRGTDARRRRQPGDQEQSRARPGRVTPSPQSAIT